MKIQQNRNNNHQIGAVSLFIVLFTALLMTIVTISFIQLMTKDADQASQNDLSQSAYDSAQGGIEDAKRALLMERDCIGDTSQRCNDIRAAIAAGQCNTLSAIFANATDEEVKIQQSTGDEKLDQGYTCVKILPDTPDFLGNIEAGMSPILVPLRGGAAVSKIEVSWGLNKTGGTVNLPPDVNTTKLPRVGATTWPQNRPAVLRTQLINGKGSFSLTDFDEAGYSDTLFLYPSQVGTVAPNFNADRRTTNNGSGILTPVACDDTPASGEYICKVTFTFQPSIPAGSETAFLSIGSFYNATDFKVVLTQGVNGNVVNFDNVQPEIDSTGRANDQFRRVVSRVEIGGGFIYPQAALETTGNLCKDFFITTATDDYLNDCTP